jgi:hypothetical protein
MNAALWMDSITIGNAYYRNRNFCFQDVVSSFLLTCVCIFDDFSLNFTTRAGYLFWSVCINLCFYKLLQCHYNKTIKGRCYILNQIFLKVLTIFTVASGNWMPPCQQRSAGTSMLSDHGLHWFTYSYILNFFPKNDNVFLWIEW